MIDSTEVHPFCNFVDACPSVIETTEFVLDGVLAAGTVVIAGERGLGKTSALVPLMASVAGLCPNFSLNTHTGVGIVIAWGFCSKDVLFTTR